MRKREKESFVRHREERKKSVFFDCSSISKHFHWNQEGVHSLENLGDQRE